MQYFCLAFGRSFVRLLGFQWDICLLIGQHILLVFTAGLSGGSVVCEHDTPCYFFCDGVIFDGFFQAIVYGVQHSVGFYIVPIEAAAGVQLYPLFAVIVPFEQFEPPYVVVQPLIEGFDSVFNDFLAFVFPVVIGYACHVLEQVFFFDESPASQA